MVFTIEKNVPVSLHLGGGSTKYPFQDMDVGDSFVVQDDGRGIKKVRSAVASAARAYSIRRRSFC